MAYFSSGRFRTLQRFATGAKFIAAIIFLIFVFHLIVAASADYSVDCKTIVRNEWIKYCATEGLKREKRETSDAAAITGHQWPLVPPFDDFSGLDFDLEEIVDMIRNITGRGPRAASVSMEKFSKQMSHLAAKCCNPNLQGPCIDSSDIIHCP